MSFRFVNALVYYGVILSAPSIGGNFYLNFFLTSLVELPAIPAGVWVFNRLVKQTKLKTNSTNTIYMYVLRYLLVILLLFLIIPFF